MLGKVLGETIKDALGEHILERVETIRKLSKSSRAGNDANRQELLTTLQNLSNDELLPVARAFSQFLNLANTAELQNLQCDITMPAGLAIDTESLAATERLNDTYSFRTATLADGRVRVILYTMSQNAVQRVISGNEGALFTFGVTATDELPETANIKISNIVAASPEAVGYYGEDALVGVTNSALTGISGVEAQGRYSEEIYTVGGVRTETTKQGVNIIRKEDGTVVKVYKK